MLQTVITGLRMAVDYRSFRLENTSTNYDRTVSKNISEMSKHATVQMKSHTFDPFDAISIIGFMCNFKLGCETNGIHEGAANSLFFIA